VPNRRETKRRLASGTAKYVFNPVVRALFRLGLPAPGTAILETTGRKSGRPRRNPVTNGLDDGVFWIVAEHGRRASYVRNIEANPNVRLRIGRRWRKGTARLVPDDDPRERLRYIASRRPVARLNTATVSLMQTDLLTIRIELNGEGVAPNRVCTSRKGEGPRSTRRAHLLVRDDQGLTHGADIRRSPATDSAARA
jgi:deazaflavin-dependent oxidoreductase (nitroreductase family)